MSVYVDPLFEWPKTRAWPYGFVSHLYADSEEELHEFAERLGMKRSWCSDKTQPGSRVLHYDLSPNKRRVAVSLGAVEVEHEHKREYYRAADVRHAEIAQRKRRRNG